MSQRPRRRASDTRKEQAPNSAPALVGAGVLLAILVGWFAWQFTNTLVPVRDGAPSWHPTEAKLVFYSEQSVPGEAGAEPSWQADLFEMNLDGSGRLNLTNTPEADEGGPAYSPNGRYLAYDTDRDGNYEIYLRDFEAPDGTPDRRLTNNGARDLSPAWDETSQTIVFMSDRSSPFFDVYELDVFVEGAVPRRLPTGPSNCVEDPTASSNWFPQYSPDGTQLAMHVCRDVHVMTLEGYAIRRLTYEPSDGMYPSWSPDGAELAFMSARNGRMEIFRMQEDGTEQERLLTMPTGGAIDPRWSPDGQYIVFVHVSEASPQAEQTPEGDRAMYLLELATGRVRRLSR